MNPQYVVLGAVETASRIIEFTPRTLFEWSVQVVNLLVIVGVLSYVLFKPVSKFLQERSDKIQNNIESANAQKAEAETLRQEYEGKLAKVEQEATEILKEARANAKKNEQEIISQARSEAEHIRERAKIDIELEQERVKDEMKQEMIKVATMMASQFVEANMDEKKQTEMIDKIIDEAGDVQWLS